VVVMVSPSVSEHTISRHNTTHPRNMQMSLSKVVTATRVRTHLIFVTSEDSRKGGAANTPAGLSKSFSHTSQALKRHPADAPARNAHKQSRT
jgi:hypothetical protein